MVNHEVRVVLQMILDSHEEGEITCKSCLDSLHTLWNLVETGADLHQLLPAMADHFDCCDECREEYEAFICIMRAETTGEALACFDQDLKRLQAEAIENKDTTPHA